jgi:metacaspase-1
MATGISIHIGLNQVDPSHYPSIQSLRGCVNDARAMEALARAQGFESTILLNEQATAAAVTAHLEAAANRLGNGDILLLTYSGHGAFVVDSNQDENDSRDETWCLFDREMPDDELYALWARFSLGTRIVVISDSCLSGSVIKFFREQNALKQALLKESSLAGEIVLPESIRAVSTAEAREIFQHNAQVYLDLQERFSDGRTVEVLASVLLISACQEWEVSRDGDPNGLFTKALLRVWNGGKFSGSYLDLHAQIHDLTRLVQRPNYLKVGEPNPAFDTQRAFTI